MPAPTVNTVWNATDLELRQLLESKTLMPKPRRIRFYAPSFTYYKTPAFCSSSKDFPTISVTGNGCALNCKHCGGKVLQTMYPAESPEKLVNLAGRLKREGASGLLVSGGCQPDGSVPLQKFVSALAKIKRDLGLTVFVHTGIIDAKTAADLKAAAVDAALIDVIGCDETLRDVYNLNVNTNSYEESLHALSQARIPFVPHIIVGLHHGELRGESAALQMIQSHNPSAVVIISFMPIHGTTMEKTQPPSPQSVARTAAAARVTFPDVPLVLGCMRPKGRHRVETDILAIKAGVDGVAFPSQEAQIFATKAGYEVAYSSYCCAQIYRDLLSK